MIRPALIAATFAVAPFAAFLERNRGEGVTTGDVAPYALAVMCLALLPVAIGYVIRRASAERVAMVVAVAVTVFFHYGNVARAADRVTTWPRVQVAAWVAVFAAAVGIAWYVSRWRGVRTYFVAAGVALVAIPAGATVIAAESPNTAADGLREPALTRADAKRERPNVYFFLLDGYARADILRELSGFDNGPFLARLERHGFVVADAARAHYTMTFLSLGSTLSMQYLARDGDVSEGQHAYFPLLGGRNATVRSFLDRGYSYVHAEPGAWSGNTCSGVEDLCVPAFTARSVEGGVGELSVELGELELALLDLTPLGVIVRRFAGIGNTLYNEPDHVVEVVHASRVREPFFAFIHIVAPHEPYRYHADCRLLDSLHGGILRGEPPTLYVDAVRCINLLMIRAVDMIIERDPRAIVVIESDHGPSFLAPVGHPLSEWSDAALRERLSILAAFRLPAECRRSVPEDVSAVNTFRIVFACLDGATPSLLPYRAWTVAEPKVEPVAESRLPARDA